MNIQTKKDIWLKYYYGQKDFLDSEISDSINKNRKGDIELTVIDEKGNPIIDKDVEITLTNHEFKHGCNIFLLDEFKDEKLNEKYRETFSKYFNLATIPFYWNDLEPTQGNPRYDINSPKIYRRPAPDLCLEYCNEKGIDAKLHCLFYDKFIPDWLPKNDMKQMEELYEKRFKEIAERYSGKLYEFEVFNEFLSEPGWQNKSIISSKRDIIEWVMNLARKYFKNDLLMCNDGNYIPSLAYSKYRHPYFMMLDAAIKGGVKFDKIGIQNHCYLGVSATNQEELEQDILNGPNPTNIFNPEKIKQGLDILTAFNIPLEITEITIPTLGETVEDEEIQADLLELSYSVWFANPLVTGAVYWNMVDGYAYNSPTWNESNGRGGLFNSDLTPKKSAERLRYLFKEKWHTNLKLKTDKNGKIKFNGFYGDYNLTVSDKTANFKLIKNKKEISIKI
ncbi:MAG: endo-1,4-beta-xylanase [Clostridia bacterium]|nr:endo-1,4-beta-xylanase [Clostridia bacterium]